MKKYKITYPLACGIPTVAFFLLSMFMLRAPIYACTILALCGTAYGWTISRVVLHLVDRDNSPRTWQLNIYALLVSIGWTVYVFATKDYVMSAGLALVAGAGLMFLGVKFDDKDENGIPDSVESVLGFFAKIGKKKVGGTEEELAETLRYKLVGDTLDGSIDETRPLAVINGKACTVNEAIKAGRTDKAQNAQAYIKSLFV